MREGLKTLKPWAWTLKRIGGTMGLGLASWGEAGSLSLEEGGGAWTPGSQGGGAGAGLRPPPLPGV